jgi:hypothetical protein
MIKIDKAITVTITAEDIAVISKICELAHLLIDERLGSYQHICGDGSSFAAFMGLTVEELADVRRVIDLVNEQL